MLIVSPRTRKPGPEEDPYRSLATKATFPVLLPEKQKKPQNAKVFLRVCR